LAYAKNYYGAGMKPCGFSLVVGAVNANAGSGWRCKKIKALFA
jgi:hypothetical protein